MQDRAVMFAYLESSWTIKTGWLLGPKIGNTSLKVYLYRTRPQTRPRLDGFREGNGRNKTN